MMTWVVAALSIVVALLLVMVGGLLRSYAEVVRALHDMGVNLDEPSETRAFSTAPRPGRAPGRGAEPTLAPLAEPTGGPLGAAHDLAGLDPAGASVAISLANQRGHVLLAFLSTGCGTCADFWAALERDASLGAVGVDPRIVVVTKGPDEESPATVAEIAPARHTTLMSTEAYDDYGVPVAPYFVLLDAGLGVVVGEGAAASWTQLRNLIGKALKDGATTSGRTRREVLGGRARARRVDDELGAAGIVPGDARLYHDAASVGLEDTPEGAESPEGAETPEGAESPEGAETPEGAEL